MAKTKQRRFLVDTATFVSIWRNHINHDSDEPAGDTQWRRFVLNCFDRFTSTNEHKNKQTLLDEDRSWGKWSDDQKYMYLNEKCYSKCISIRRRLRKETGYTPELPNGYLARNGTTPSKRLTAADITALFKAD